ncbi:MAG TPA: ribosome recycling factor [Planctomycetaceae bacterium]|nr:ribosome recycling factor [Planctomycetaceae bacterium]HQZ67809.1 ribosome recycling factor [Planctomycetaceae bacterium]
MNQDEILMDAEERMEKAVNVLNNAMKGIRTGRANPGLVDSLRVDSYGSPTPLKQLANISVPEPQQIMIRPFDTTTLDAIAKAITASELGMVPNNDGRVIRLNVPPLSTERRKQMTGRIKELAEESRVAIRNVRRDANKHADNSEKAKVLSKDECKHAKDQVQELTKKYEGLVNDRAASKEIEVMEN